MTQQKQKKIVLIVAEENEVKKSLRIARKLSLKNEILFGLYRFELKKYFAHQNLSYLILPEAYLTAKNIDHIDHLSYQVSRKWFIQNNKDQTLYRGISLGKILQVPVFFYLKKTLEKIEMLRCLVKRNGIKELIFFSDPKIFNPFIYTLNIPTKFYRLPSLSIGWKNILKFIYYHGYLVYLTSYLGKFIKKIKSSKSLKHSPRILFFYDKGFKVLEPVRHIASRKKEKLFEILTTGDPKIDNHLKEKPISYSTLNSDLNLEPFSFFEKIFWLEKIWRKKIRNHLILNYHGTNLNIKSHDLKNLWQRAGFSHLCYLEAAEKYFSRQKKLKSVVVPQDVWPFAKTIILTAQKNNIFTLVVQHGVTLDKEYYKIAYLPLTADKIAVWGKISKNYFLRNGVPKNKIKITGFPGFDRLIHPKFRFNHSEFCKQYHIDPKKRLVLYITQNFSEKKKGMIFENILKVSRALPQIFFIVKLHPAPEETISFYSSILQEKKYIPKNILFLKDEDTLSLVQICDLLITVHSTVHLEATLLDKDIIILNFDHDPELAISKYKAALNIDKSNQLAKSIQNILYHPKIQQELQNNRQKFIKDYTFKNDGRASQRIWILANNGFIPSFSKEITRERN